jgi:hypothetical protein
MITFAKRRVGSRKLSEHKLALQRDSLSYLSLQVATKFGYSEVKKMSVDELLKCVAFMELDGGTDANNN